MKKTISIILTVAILLCSFSSISFNASAEETVSNNGYYNGQLLTLGSYPQTEVTDEKLIDDLNSLGGRWLSCDYYDSTGQQSDFMKYKDVTYHGNRYRAVSFSSYRRGEIEYSCDTTYWFLYEPLQWRLLNAETGLAVCEQIIDAQPYHHTSATTNGYYANNYEQSDIRKWLTDTFYNTAFSSSNKNNILNKEIDNTACATSVQNVGSYTQYSSKPTHDSVFLLSKSEADTYASSYFKTSVTDYAYSNGFIPGSGTEPSNHWFLRTAGNNTYQVWYVQIRWGVHQTYYNWYDDALQTLMGIRPAIYLDLDNLGKYIQREDGFNFYLNHQSNYINVNSTVELHVGYYLNNSLDTSTENYIYTVSNSNVIGVTDNGWSSKYGQKLKIKAKQKGSSTITITNPDTFESSSIEIFVTENESGWNFYNIPKMTIEIGKTTNFYNYSGMVVDDFAYTEHKNSLGVTDYYNVTMTVYNSVNLYGVVTSHNADGSIRGYSIIDKKDSHDFSFVESTKSLYYSTGDAYHLWKNDKFYSGKSITTENKVEIDVPVGGYISISNNVAVSDMANLVNFAYLLFDTANVVGGWADWDVSGKYVIDDIKKTAINNLIAGVLANKAIKDELLSCLKKSVSASFNELSLNNDNLIDAFVSVSDKLGKNFGYNIIEELESEICSAMGIASIGESVATKVLPTGWIIEGLYQLNVSCDYMVFFNTYCKSKNYPTGINIYAPTNSSKYYSNGIAIETEDDMSETVVHAYTVADTGRVGITNNTFTDESIYYSEKYQTYNISLYKNGTESQPNSTVTVKIPIPDKFKLNRSALKVYRNNENGTLTNMNARIEGEYIVFETNHFSYYSIVDESAPLLTDDLKFCGASLTLQNNLTVNYKVDATDLLKKGYENPYIEFSINGKKTTVTDFDVDGNKYVFNFSNISPNLANDIIYATIYAEKNGITYFSETKEYSVAEYCYNILNKYSDNAYSKLHTLVVDLLNYCAQSQIYTKYNTGNLANGALTEVQRNWGTLESPKLSTVFNATYKTVDTPAAGWKGAGLILDDSVTLRFKFTSKIASELTVKVSNGLENWTIFSDDFEYGNGVCYVNFEDLHAAQMSDKIYITLYDGAIPVSDTVCYSVESYAYKMQNCEDTKLSALVNAMMNYGNSARDYSK